MPRQRQVERWVLFGLLWTQISPLQMNINKELLISAACTVREYVCRQGREQALLLCCSSSAQPVLPSLLSSSSFWLLSCSFFGFLPAHPCSLSCWSRTVMPHGKMSVMVIQEFSPYVLPFSRYIPLMVCIWMQGFCGVCTASWIVCLGPCFQAVC